MTGIRSAAVIISLVLVATMLLAAVTVAADISADPSLLPSVRPEATTAGLLAGGDPRSEGEGPGLVGQPLLILLAVVGLGLVTAGATALIARLWHRA